MVNTVSATTVHPTELQKKKNILKVIDPNEDEEHRCIQNESSVDYIN